MSALGGSGGAGHAGLLHLGDYVPEQEVPADRCSGGPVAPGGSGCPQDVPTASAASLVGGGARGGPERLEGGCPPPSSIEDQAPAAEPTASRTAPCAPGAPADRGQPVEAETAITGGGGEEEVPQAQAAGATAGAYLNRVRRALAADASALPAFPEGAWRGVFSTYREVVGPTTEAAEVFLWGALAAGLAVLVGRTFRLPWGPSALYANLVVALVGETGKARKSTALDDVHDLVIEPLKPAPQAEGEPPVFEVVSGSGSGEGFVDAIADREWEDAAKAKHVQTGRSAFFIIHELAALLEKARRGQAGNMIEFLIRLYDAPMTWTHRTRTKPVTMTGSLGVVAAATTTAWLVETLGDSDVMAGLANRILWLTGGRGQAVARRPAIPEEGSRRIREQAQEVLDAVRGQTARLTAGADALHAAIYQIEYDRDPESEVAAAATARSDSIALKLALLLAAADQTAEIDVDHIGTAWEIVAYSNATAAGIVARIHEQTLREAEERVRAAACRTAAKNGGTFTKRAVRQRVKGRNGMPAETFQRSWDALVAAGDIEVNDSGTCKVSS